MNARIRVLVVDDSAFARKVMREVLSAAPDIEVVGIARDGLEAMEKIAELSPDVITLDLVMPHLDGLGVLDGLRGRARPRVLVVSTSHSDSELALAALERGAIDLLAKPTALATDRLYELRDELLTKVRMAAHAERGAPPPREETPSWAPLEVPRVRELLVIGTSTGGPQALTQLLADLPADFPLPIAIALHIPAGYTDALAKRLDSVSPLEVREAEEGMLLRPGRAVLARGGSHLRVHRRDGQLFAGLSRVPSKTAHFPSVNVLFESAAEACGAGAVALVLTGMGDDGSHGAVQIRRCGGLVLTEAASSCVVYGMPRAIVEAGNSDGDAPLSALPALLRAKA